MGPARAGCRRSRAHCRRPFPGRGVWNDPGSLRVREKLGGRGRRGAVRPSRFVPRLFSFMKTEFVLSEMLVRRRAADLFPGAAQRFFSGALQTRDRFRFGAWNDPGSLRVREKHAGRGRRGGAQPRDSRLACFHSGIRIGSAKMPERPRGDPFRKRMRFRPPSGGKSPGSLINTMPLRRTVVTSAAAAMQRTQGLWPFPGHSAARSSCVAVRCRPGIVPDSEPGRIPDRSASGKSMQASPHATAVPKQRPGAVSRPGAVFQFQFPE
jgi:hypothetical protein